MGPKEQGIQEKMEVKGTSRVVVMMENLRFQSGKTKTNWSRSDGKDGLQKVKDYLMNLNILGDDLDNFESSRSNQ